MCPCCSTKSSSGSIRRPGQTFVDGTLGAGGHTRAIAERVGREGRVVALDLDPAALAAAERNLAGLPVLIAQANFCDLGDVLAELHIAQVNGILLDIGLSSDQLADPMRGFSFDAEGPLDLRFDPTAGEPAWRLLERLSAEELANLIYEFGEERFSRRIARRIVEQRRAEPIRTAQQLASLVRGPCRAAATASASIRRRGRSRHCGLRSIAN